MLMIVWKVVRITFQLCVYIFHVNLHCFVISTRLLHLGEGEET